MGGYSLLLGILGAASRPLRAGQDGTAWGDEAPDSSSRIPQAVQCCPAAASDASRQRPQTRQPGSLRRRTVRHSIASPSSSKQSAVQGFADAGGKLEDLSRLYRADHADQRCEHTHDGASRFLDLGVFGKQAAVAGARRLAQIEHAHLAVEAHARPRDERAAVLHASAVDGVAGGEVVGAVDDDVGIRDQAIEPIGADALRDRR